MNKNNEKEYSKKKQKPKDPTEIAVSLVKNYENYGIDTDPLGSWTGVPDDKDSIPIQDADDL